MKFIVILIGFLFSCSSYAEDGVKDLAEVIKEDRWAGAEGTHNDLPLIIRFRSKLTPASYTHHLPQLIQIYWDYADSPSGMPSESDSKAMRDFEDRLVEALESDLSGVLAGVVTTNGYREWVFYTGSAALFSEKLHNMPQEDEPYPIQIETRKDPEWKYFFDTIRPKQ